MGLLVFAIFAALDRFFFGFDGGGALMVSLLLTLFNIASALAIFSLSFSVVPSCGAGLLVTSTVIDRCPSSGCGCPVTGGPVTGFR
jgi:hypothetical protein